MIFIFVISIPFHVLLILILLHYMVYCLSGLTRAKRSENFKEMLMKGSITDFVFIYVASLF